MTLVINGIGVTDGIALGQIHRLGRGELALPEFHLREDAVDDEVERASRAFDRSDRFLSKLLARLPEESGDTAVEVLEAHRLIMRDPLLKEATLASIRQDRINAEWALAQQSDLLQDQFNRIGDHYLARRSEDLDQVVDLIQRQLAEQPATLLTAQVPHQMDRTILVASEISAADMAQLHGRRVAGLITEHGGPWSHSAIMARSLEIPMIVGAHRALAMLVEGELAIIDGHYGAVLLDFDDGLKTHYEEKRVASLRHRADLSRYLDRPARTVDGERFELYGNAELPVEVRRCRESHADGIGLMRTEHLFMGPEAPDEESQYRTYRAAVEIMEGLPVTIRTLDAGGDKLPPTLADLRGANPALGLRGLRLSLSIRELFRHQIRAILRASHHGPVRILLPMLSSVDEVREVRGLIAACREELRAEGVALDPQIQLGGMIEVPAAALTVRALARELDFLSIGTNDLIQYVLAVDRQDELVSHLYDPTHPALLTLIDAIVSCGQEFDQPVTLCGELAGDPRYTRLLLGLGVTRFSMPAGHLGAVKKVLLSSHAARCREIVADYRVGNLAGKLTGADALIEMLEREGGAA